MKPLDSISKTLSLLTLLLFACFYLSAQSLTETLQKQVWPTASPLSMDAWENLLPANGHDTIVDLDGSTAEIVQLDSLGRPNQVILLQRNSNLWTPQTKTQAQFDERGNLVTLQSWTFENKRWVNQSKTIRTMDRTGNEITFEMMVWEGGEWHSTYRKTAAGPAETLSAKLMP